MWRIIIDLLLQIKSYIFCIFNQLGMVVKTSEIDNNKIRYLEEGSSENALLLLHGLGASAERWEHVIPLFAKEYRVIVPDLVGFGHSDKPMVDYTMEYFSEFTSKFVESIGIKKLNIIGSSLGGSDCSGICSQS